MEAGFLESKSLITTHHSFGFPGGTVVKNLPANAGDPRDTGSIPGSGRSPGEGNSNRFQYSCLENPINSGAWGGYSPWGHKESDTTEHTHVIG